MLHKRDLLKLVPLVALAGVLMYDNPNWSIILFSVGVLSVFALASHLTRKILFWGLSMDDSYRKALEHPIGGAIVFASYAYFLTESIKLGVGFLR